MLCVSIAIAGQAPAGKPASVELAPRIRQGVQLNDQLLKDFIYIERRRDVRISRLGKVTIGPLRTFEVTPGAGSRDTYKRLIAVDGVPLTAEELDRRDAEHRQDLEEVQRGGSAAERSRTEDQRQRELILDDAFKVFEAKVDGRDVLDGRPVLIARVTPRAEAPVVTREGRWMRHFEGQLWIDESDYQIVKVDMRAVRDVTIGWGVVGRIHKGSRVHYARRRFENAWLPSEVTYEASGRTLIFRPFQFSVTTTYSDYRRRDKSVTN